MTTPNYSQIFAIRAKNKRKILEVCPTAKDQSGIYIMTREENGFKYCYVGQAVKVLSRLADHLNGYQHIDLSIKNHKFYSANNPTGWKIGCLYFPEQLLDEKEQFYTMQYANAGYQMRNKTGGDKARVNLELPKTNQQEVIMMGKSKEERIWLKKFVI